eukprot:4618-Heterococcus_DN1.PRE.2
MAMSQRLLIQLCKQSVHMLSFASQRAHAKRTVHHSALCNTIQTLLTRSRANLVFLRLLVWLLIMIASAIAEVSKSQQACDRNTVLA